jgi:hypothetical protein
VQDVGSWSRIDQALLMALSAVVFRAAGQR